jgi:hypothetical protein
MTQTPPEGWPWWLDPLTGFMREELWEEEVEEKDTKECTIRSPPTDLEKDYPLPPHIHVPVLDDMVRFMHYEKYWPGWKIKGECQICLKGGTVMAPIEWGMGGEGLWLKGCLNCGHRVEVDEYGQVPKQKTFGTQTTETDFRSLEYGHIFRARNTARLRCGPYILL